MIQMFQIIFHKKDNFKYNIRKQFNENIFNKHRIVLAQTINFPSANDMLNRDKVRCKRLLRITVAGNEAPTEPLAIS